MTSFCYGSQDTNMEKRIGELRQHPAMGILLEMGFHVYEMNIIRSTSSVAHRLNHKDPRSRNPLVNQIPTLKTT